MKWSTDEFTGKRFGKYEVLCRLAVGGMAEIFLGFAHVGMNAGRAVVLKRILNEQREDPAALQMLIDEAKLTATLNHPNVAQVLDLEKDGEEVVLVIEFISGANVEEVVDVYKARAEPVPLGFALAAIREAAQGLAHAHGHRDAGGGQVPIIHRDVTPRNVMVDFDGAIKVLDFGIARAKGSERRTQVGMVRGTTAYMSPEQAIGKELDPRTDLFSLGVIAHELLTGQRLFYKGNPAQEMAAVYEGDIPLPSKVNRRVPKAVDPVVMRALERKLDRRYQTALEFTRDLALAAGSTTWPRERNAEMVRAQFAERQKDTEKLLARVPVRAPSYPEGRTQITRGGNVFFEPPPRTVLPNEPSSRPLLPPPPPIETDSAGQPAHAATPAREPVTDTARAADARLTAGQLFEDLEDASEQTRIIPGSRMGIPPVEAETDPRRPAAARPSTPRKPTQEQMPAVAVDLPLTGENTASQPGNSSVPLVIAAILALVLGAAGGAFVFKWMQSQGGPLVPVTISADRTAEVVYNGRTLGKTPVKVFFPTGRHVVQLRETDAGTSQFEFEASEGENTFDVTLDTLRPVP